MTKNWRTLQLRAFALKVFAVQPLMFFLDERKPGFVSVDQKAWRADCHQKVTDS